LPLDFSGEIAIGYSCRSGAQYWEEGVNQCVAFRFDLRERKRSEEALRDQAHVNRLSAMGELAGSLAYEITQPIAAARDNARAALNFLDKEPPDLGEVREALVCVVGDTDRAAIIIDRIHDYTNKASPRKRRFDLNEAIKEVVLLARSAIAKNGVPSKPT
jgi:C4-dicarboxylate-specific signal transduction histidine kinase